MSEVGIRALKQNASKVVARAVAGEDITITDRGRPVARLVPIRESKLDAMIRDGRARPATADLRDLPLPLPPSPGRPTISDVLREMRDDERY